MTNAPSSAKAGGAGILENRIRKADIYKNSTPSASPAKSFRLKKTVWLGRHRHRNITVPRLKFLEGGDE